MDTKFEFLASEKSEYIAIFKRIKEAIGDSFQENDEANIKSHLKTSLENGLITRDAFGLNPVLNSMQTAEIAVNEIGLKRDGVVAILLYQSVVGGMSCRCGFPACCQCLRMSLGVKGFSV